MKPSEPGLHLPRSSAALVLLVLMAAHPWVLAFQDDGVRRASFWPLLPASVSRGTTPLLVDPAVFKFKDKSVQTNSTVGTAVAIYRAILFPSRGRVAQGTRNLAAFASSPHYPRAYSLASLVGIEIVADDPAARPPGPYTDESYELSIPDSQISVGRLTARTYVGVLRGLETLSQMLVYGVVSIEYERRPAKGG